MVKTGKNISIQKYIKRKFCHLVLLLVSLNCRMKVENILNRVLQRQFCCNCNVYGKKEKPDCLHYNDWPGKFLHKGRR
jgi:hypothetical protein